MIVKQIIENAIAPFTPEELAELAVNKETSRSFNGTNWIVYQVDEPEINYPEPVKPLNYYGLEQGLFKSPVFQKYITQYNANGLLFTQTINNGKRGEDVNEQTLLLGLNVMGIDFTKEDKEAINTILTANNFTIRL